jgi:hypothetical protein
MMFDILSRSANVKVANRADVRSNATIFTDTALRAIAMHRPRGSSYHDIVVTSDKASFLGLRQIYWPDVSEQQIEKWYDPFVPVVRKYDDIINNHIRFLDS